jgi:hypothetical protein
VTKVQFVIASNEDNTEKTMVSKLTWDHFQHHRFDTDGDPLIVRKEFEASSWEEAKKIQKEFWGW